ncbi:uncharacterized protein [Asterias amurensis]|uniref:uncharacterized protein n=1 Tax=Asterias amurensis TaxID=7602 RepID=UPI003AB6940F
MAEKARPKSQSTQTESSMSPFFSQLLDPANLEYLWPALLIVVFLGLVWTKSRRTWMLVDALAMVACGLALLFVPEKVFGLMLTNPVKMDLFLTVLCRIVAAVVFGSGIVWICLRKSTDNYTQNMLLGTRVVGTCAMLVATHVLQSEEQLFSDKFARLSMLDCILWMLGSAYFFMSAKNYGGHSQLDSWLNLHLRLDFLLTLMFGLVWFAFPEFVMKMHSTGVKPAVVHTLMGQIVGAMMIGSAILSAVAPGFMFHEDKRNVLLCKILTLLLIVVMALSSLDHSNIGRGVMLSHLMGVVWVINAAMGYFAPHETDGYLSARKNAKTE